MLLLLLHGLQRGLFAQDMGRYAEALRSFQQALRIREAALGRQHPDAAATINNIGLTLAVRSPTAPRRAAGRTSDTRVPGSRRQSTGQYDEALRCYEEALRARTAALGAEHHEVGRTLWNMGALFKKQGDAERARRTLLEAHRIFAARLGAEHPHAMAVDELLRDLPGSAGDGAKGLGPAGDRV